MVQVASEFAARNQLPQQIEEQMLNHICLRFRTEGLKQQETLDMLPKAMRSSISLYLFFPVVQGSYLFKGVSSGFIQQLATEMQPEYFAPKEDIMLQNDKPSDMYLLVSGAVVRCCVRLLHVTCKSIPNSDYVMTRPIAFLVSLAGHSDVPRWNRAGNAGSTSSEF